MAVSEPTWKKFNELVRLVQQDHQKQRAVCAAGHDFEHAFAVAQHAKSIAEDDRIGELGWIAGVCHNTDRIFPDASETEVRAKVSEYLSVVPLDENEKTLVLEAVMEHSKKNDPKDNPVTVALKDADQIENISALAFIRSGQHFHDLQPVDYRHLWENPDATFKNPLSVARDLRHHLEWESWLRTPKAREIAAPRFEFLRLFLSKIEKELKDAGLFPYPF